MEVLIVADVGEDGLDDREAGAVARRDREPRSQHERREAERLERDRLAARVGAGHDDRLAGARLEIARDDVDAVEHEERVARVPEGHDERLGRGRDLGEREAELPREARGGGAHVGVDERAHGDGDGVRVLARLRGEGREDGALGAIDLGVDHLEAVARLDDGLRLHEDGGAARARGVHDAGEALVRIGAHGEDVAAVALGEVAVLEEVGVARRELLELANEAIAHVAALGAEGRELGGRAVRDAAVGLEGDVERALEGVELGVRRARVAEARGALLAGREEASKRVGRRKDAVDRAQLLDGERGADARAIEGLARIGERPRRERLGGLVERDGFTHLFERAKRGGAVLGEREALGGALSEGALGALGEGREEAIPLEIEAGFAGTDRGLLHDWALRGDSWVEG